MMKLPTTTYFTHYKEIAPWDTKIEALADIAQKKGFKITCPDYSELPNPTIHAKRLLSLQYSQSPNITVLVGSGIGAYTATVASTIINPAGLFLIGPEFCLPGRSRINIVPQAQKTAIIHGLRDEIVSFEKAIRFAKKHSTELYLVDSDHRLTDQIPKIKALFKLFLDDILVFNNAPHILTWEKLAATCELDSPWAMLIWKRLSDKGLANFRNAKERNDVLLRFLALTDFYYQFLSRFCRDRWGCAPSDTVNALGEPQELLGELLADFSENSGTASNKKPTIHDALQEIARDHIYPALFKEFGEFEDIALSIYKASYPTIYEDVDDRELTALEDLVDEYIVRKDCFSSICEWLREKFQSDL